jgi:hypothetical protein
MPIGEIIGDRDKLVNVEIFGHGRNFTTPIADDRPITVPEPEP